jgi:hypothetical protein
MRLPRFKIGDGLALIAILAVALAALRTPSYLWANVTYSLALGAVVVAIVNFVYGREARRAYWLGFSLCGGIYLTVCSVPVLRDSVGTRLVTEAILDFIYPHLSPASATSPSTVPLVVAASTASLSFTVSGTTINGPQGPIISSSPGSYGISTFVAQPQPPPPSRWAEWTQPDRVISSRIQTAPVALCSSEAFRQIGHSMFTLIVAVLGATFARHRYLARMTDRPTSHSAS